MAKLNFMQAKSRFKTIEDVAAYFILVESYEKHLNADQKEKFLNPDTIEDMFKILSDKQLKHLRSLIKVMARSKLYPKSQEIIYGGEQFSDWFKKNLYKNSSCGIDKPDKFYIDVCKSLLERLVKFGEESGRTQKYIKDIIAEYKTKLKRFGGNSVEYREWLILLTTDHGIPGIEKTYNVTKLLKSLDLYILEKLRHKIIFGTRVDETIRRIKYIEPYLYWQAIKSVDKSDLDITVGANYRDGIRQRLRDDGSEASSFLFAVKDLISKIGNIIKQKREFVEQKLEGLSKTTTFYRDIEEILRSVSSVDDKELKDTIAEYCGYDINYHEFGLYFRKKLFLEALLKGKLPNGLEIYIPPITSEKINSYRNKIQKVIECFEKCIIDKEYTVYRGMRLDGLFALLNNAYPNMKMPRYGVIDDDLFEKLNKGNLVVSDDGPVSTSLKRGVSLKQFHGEDGVLFTIRVPKGSKAIVLDYEGIETVAWEEEVLLAPKTKIKINSAKLAIKSKGLEGKLYYEIDAEVAN